MPPRANINSEMIETMGISKLTAARLHEFISFSLNKFKSLSSAEFFNLLEIYFSTIFFSFF